MTIPAEWSAQEIIDLLDPDEPPIDQRSDEGRRIIRSMYKGNVHLILKHGLSQMMRLKRPWSGDDVRNRYEASYDISADDYLARRETYARKLPYRVGDEFIVRVSPLRNSMVGRMKIADVIAALKPRTVCEVGSGAGTNLLLLANRFPDIAFSGFELTASGTRLARALQVRDLHDTRFGKDLRLTPEGRDAIGRITFSEGSAYDLPCPDDAYDLVFTHSALEQMAEGLPTALAEIRRIAKRHVVFHEAFADANGAWGRLYLKVVNYFRMSVVEVEEFGFKPIAYLSHLTKKPSFTNSILVAEVG